MYHAESLKAFVQTHAGESWKPDLPEPVKQGGSPPIRCKGRGGQALDEWLRSASCVPSGSGMALDAEARISRAFPSSIFAPISSLPGSPCGEPPTPAHQDSGLSDAEIVRLKSLSVSQVLECMRSGDIEPFARSTPVDEQLTSPFDETPWQKPPPPSPAAPKPPPPPSPTAWAHGLRAVGAPHLCQFASYPGCTPAYTQPPSPMSNEQWPRL